jgi:TetR/AcrR family transcriptional repressor of nem operon
MRYGDGHKQRTRKKVVHAAAAALRVRGPEGVSVAEVMAEAGLTHGGYAELAARMLQDCRMRIKARAGFGSATLS